MRNHRAVAVLLCERDGVERFGQRADLIEFDENRVGDALVDAFLKNLGVGHKQVIANKLNPIANGFGQREVAVPIVFVEAIFDGHQRIFFDHLFPVVDHACGIHGAVLARQDIFSVLVKLARGGVDTEDNIRAGLQSGAFNGLHQQIKCLGVRTEVRRKAALVSHARGQLLLEKGTLESVENLCAPPERFAEGRSADGQHHELLDVEVVVGVRSPIDDVHHGKRQQIAVDAAEIAVEREFVRVSRGSRTGNAHAQKRIGAKLGFGLRPVEFEQQLIDVALIGRIHSHKFGTDHFIDVVHGVLHAFAHVALFLAVPQFQRFALAG